jgi:PAS domain S-box-containing protein
MNQESQGALDSEQPPSDQRQAVSFRDVLATHGLENSNRLRDLLLAVFEESPDALFVKDRQGKYLLCNPTVARLVGKPVEEILGRDDTALFDSASAARVMARDRRVLETGQTETEEEILMASGQTRIYRAIKAPYVSSEGDILGVVGISRDITESRRAEEALRQSEHVLRLVVEALPVGVQVMDLKGDIFITNPAAERIWGKIVGPGEQRYATVKGRWHDSGQLIGHDEWASTRAISRGEVSRNEVIDIEAFDGRPRTILNSGAPIRDRHQAILGAVIINEDITDRLRLEKQYLQAQKMEGIGQLAAGAAHDFNNLLSVVSGYGELLLEDLGPDHGSRDLVTEILEASKKAATLTKQLLAFSRKTVLNPKVVDLNTVLEQTQKMLHRLLGEDITLSVHLEDSPCWTKVDLVQFDQILMNLCANARDAMPTGGRLSIHTSLSQDHKGLIKVTVTDSGEGMSKEVQDRIFEPFFTTKETGRGTGLGLATVYGIVQQSGGQVEVESAPGQGSSFHLYFPLLSEPTPFPAATAALKRSLGEETILLVEDQEAVRGVFALTLARSGYQVIQAASGPEALRLWQETPNIDLVVTDVVMPEMSGRHLVEQLRILRPDVKVLYMSGHTTDAALRHGVSPTEVAWLQKPFSVDALTEKVRQILDA